MFSYANRTVFDIPLTWNRARFEATREKCRQARKLVDISVNVQFEKKLRDQYLENLNVEKNITTSQDNLRNHDKKVEMIDRLLIVASESLPNYFDKRMELVRNSIKEHCDAIQRIIREENEHWQEINSAIDQNLVTASDFQVRQTSSDEQRQIDTINEADEENPSQLVNSNTVTSIVTNMIRRSHSVRHSEASTTSIECQSSSQAILSMKQERQSIFVASSNLENVQHPSDTTYFVKHEEQTENENDTSRPSVSECNMSENLATITNSQVAASPIFSQPNPPARLYFSPTLLQDEADIDDDEQSSTNESRTIGEKQQVLSTLDQNQIDPVNPRTNVRRLGQTFLLNNMKSEEEIQPQQQSMENVESFARPTITEDYPVASIDPNPLVPDNPPTPQETVERTTRRTRAVVKREPRTTRVTRIEQNPVETTRAQTRKRKKSSSEDVDPKSTSAASRKRKPVAVVEPEEKIEKVVTKKANPKKKQTNKKKTKKAKEPEIPIREPSPLPLIDRSRHYSTRFSTRSHRFNNFTLPPLNTEDDDENQKAKARPTRATRARAKKTSRETRKTDQNNDLNIPDKSKKTKKTGKTKKTKKN